MSLQIRKPRKKRRVMGCELSRQLKSPARGCGRSIAGAERLLLLRGRRFAAAGYGIPINVSIIGEVWLSQPLACRVSEVASDRPWQHLPNPLTSSYSSSYCLCISLIMLPFSSSSL